MTTGLSPDEERDLAALQSTHYSPYSGWSMCAPGQRGWRLTWRKLEATHKPLTPETCPECQRVRRESTTGAALCVFHDPIFSCP